MNGKTRDMDYKFAIEVLNSAKVETPSMHGNPKRYGYQNQTFYDIARRMAIEALKDKYENSKPTADVAEVKRGAWSRGKESSGGIYAHCSACDTKMDYSCYGYAYCPLCGARMDGKI